MKAFKSNCQNSTFLKGYMISATIFCRVLTYWMLREKFNYQVNISSKQATREHNSVLKIKQLNQSTSVIGYGFSVRYISLLLVIFIELLWKLLVTPHGRFTLRKVIGWVFFDIRNNQCWVNTTKSLHYSGCYRNRIYNCFIIHWFEENIDKQHRCKYNSVSENHELLTQQTD